MLIVSITVFVIPYTPTKGDFGTLLVPLSKVSTIINVIIALNRESFFRVWALKKVSFFAFFVLK